MKSTPLSDIEARERRENAERLLATGVDPALQRDIDKQTAVTAAEDTFRSVAKEWLTIKHRGWSASHDKRITAILTNDVYPQIRKHPIASITGPAVLATIRKIEQRGAHEIAIKALATYGDVFRHAYTTGATDRDPTAGLRDFLAPKPPVKHYPHVTETELPVLLERIGDYSGNLGTRIAVKSMILTFLRTNELRWARWEDFDFDSKEWRVPAEHMKDTSIKRRRALPTSCRWLVKQSRCLDNCARSPVNPAAFP